jgi:hypothetical protein
MTSFKITPRTVALTAAGFAAATMVTIGVASAEPTPSPGPEPAPTLVPTTTTVVPVPDYYPNETGGGDSESEGSSDDS